MGAATEFLTRVCRALATALRSVTEWKPVHTRRNWIWIQSCTRSHTALGQQHIMCKYVCSFHLMLNTELWPYIPDTFSCKIRHVCTQTHAGVAFYLRSQNMPGGQASAVAT